MEATLATETKNTAHNRLEENARERMLYAKKLLDAQIEVAHAIAAARQLTPAQEAVLEGQLIQALATNYLAAATIMR